MTSKFLLSGLLCLLCSGFLMAEGNDPMVVKSTVNGTEVELLLANLEGQTTTVQLYSLDSGELIWSDKVKAHNGYSYDVDLADLDFGRYYFKISKGEAVKKQVVLVNERGVALSDIK